MPIYRRLLGKPVVLLVLLAQTLFFLWISMRYMGARDYRFHVPEDGEDHRKFMLGDTRELAILLLDVYQQLEQAFQAKKPPSLRSLQDLKYVTTQLYPPVDIDTYPRAVQVPVVCPEHYFGPESSEGWQTLNCTGVQPISELVTIIVNVREVSTTDKRSLVMQLLEDFSNAYPGMRVVVIDSGLLAEDISSTGRVKLLESGNEAVKSGASGGSWNAAIKLVRTKFVFLARDVWRFSRVSSPMDRLLRLLTEVPGVCAVGGALRNRNGHWKIGCFQSEMKNYVLKYQKGYHFSRNGSMFCDYLDGPFMAHTSMLKQTLLDGQLGSDVLFQDLFLHLSTDWLTMVAPDVMFYSSGPMTDTGGILFRDTWLAFARKWELNRIAINLQLSSILHKYSCSDIDFSCGQMMGATNSFTIPVCCQEEFAKAVAYLESFCNTYNMSCQFDCGNSLGAVKMSDLMPWDIDGDSGYPEQNYSFIKSMAPEFQKRGFQLFRLQDPVCCDKSMPNGLKRSYFRIKVSGMHIEMYGDWWIPHDTLLFNKTSPRTDTKIEIHGVWASSTPNPGHYSRRRYGRECLKHAHNWRQTGMKTSWEEYKAGHFHPCKNPGHHSCLDKLPVDGNIGFLVPQ